MTNKHSMMIPIYLQMSTPSTGLPSSCRPTLLKVRGGGSNNRLTSEGLSSR